MEGSIALQSSSRTASTVPLRQSDVSSCWYSLRSDREAATSSEVSMPGIPLILTAVRSLRLLPGNLVRSVDEPVTLFRLAARLPGLLAQLLLDLVLGFVVELVQRVIAPERRNHRP